jgi:hypothetical protein
VTTMVEAHRLLRGGGGINNVPSNENFVQNSSNRHYRSCPRYVCGDEVGCRGSQDRPFSSSALRCRRRTCARADHQPRLPHERTRVRRRRGHVDTRRRRGRRRQRRGGRSRRLNANVRLTPMSRGGRQAAATATLPSPILAAASLPPASPSGRRRSGGGGGGGGGGDLSRVSSCPGTLRIGS